MDDRPIGVFDSGVGGLTVVRQLKKALPQEDIIYFGDTARLPYGSKSREAIIRFSQEIVRFLLEKNVKAIVIACNTASSNALLALRESFSVPIFGVVEPGVSETLRLTKNKRVGVIGTAGTIKSGAYETLLHQADPGIQVFSQSCPLFVPLAEEGWLDDPVTRQIAKRYLTGLVKEGIDSLVLGCTHYPLLKTCIGETVGDSVRLIDPAKSAAQEVKQELGRQGLLRTGKTAGTYQFFASDDTAQFGELCQNTLSASYPLTIASLQ